MNMKKEVEDIELMRETDAKMKGLQTTRPNKKKRYKMGLYLKKYI